MKPLLPLPYPETRKRRVDGDWKPYKVISHDVECPLCCGDGEVEVALNGNSPYGSDYAREKCDCNDGVRTLTYGSKDEATGEFHDGCLLCEATALVEGLLVPSEVSLEALRLVVSWREQDEEAKRRADIWRGEVSK